MASPTEKNDVTLVPAAEIRVKKVVYTKILFVLLVLVVGLGTLNLYSGSSGGAVFYNQLRLVGMGFAVFFFCGWFVPPRLLKTYAYWIFGAVTALLVAVLVLGQIKLGAQRWIDLGFMNLQPSEAAKVALAIVVARFFYTSKLNRPYTLRDLWPVLALVGVTFGLIFPQPDFGTAGLCLMIALVQILFVRLDWRSITIVVVTGLVTAPLAWQFALKDYQRHRVLNFLDPDNDPQGTGYNALQSLIAVGSGGMSGKGFMQGTQTQLQFLPMSHSDFVFSVFAEEHGFRGAIIVVLLFAGITYVALEIARQARDTFSALLAVGLAAFLFCQAAVNIAMVLHMFPIVGVPLPFFTHGGSILLTVCAAMGLLVSIDRDNVGLTKKPASLHRAKS
jgi:rod shape determining protein RodA